MTREESFQRCVRCTKREVLLKWTGGSGSGSGSNLVFVSWFFGNAQLHVNTLLFVTISMFM